MERERMIKGYPKTNSSWSTKEKMSILLVEDNEEKSKGIVNESLLSFGEAGNIIVKMQI